MAVVLNNVVVVAVIAVGVTVVVVTVLVVSVRRNSAVAAFSLSNTCNSFFCASTIKKMQKKKKLTKILKFYKPVFVYDSLPLPFVALVANKESD